MRKLSILLLLASAASATPVGVSGSGFFGRNYPDAPQYQANITSPSFAAVIASWGFCCALSNGNAGPNYAYYQGVAYPNFSFWLAGGVGEIVIWQDAGQEIARFDLVGFVQVTSYTQYSQSSYSGTFAISPVAHSPEPVTILMMVAGMFVIGMRRTG